MSLRNRARSLQAKTGLSYQQALAKLRALGERPARLKRETGWPLEVCDRYLVDGHAPIEVLDARRQGREEQIENVCEALRMTAAARAVVLFAFDGSVFCHLGDADLDRSRFPATIWMRAVPLPPEIKRKYAALPDVQELDGGLVLVSATIKERAMLIVKFHRDQTSLGIVRMRMKKAIEELEPLLADEETPQMPPIAGSGGTGGLPGELQPEEPVPAERPKKKPTPIGRRKKR
jgi:hypothetical protein